MNGLITLGYVVLMVACLVKGDQQLRSVGQLSSSKKNLLSAAVITASQGSSYYSGSSSYGSYGSMSAYSMSMSYGSMSSMSMSYGSMSSMSMSYGSMSSMSMSSGSMSSGAFYSSSADDNSGDDQIRSDDGQTGSDDGQTGSDDSQTGNDDNSKSSNNDGDDDSSLDDGEVVGVTVGCIAVVGLVGFGAYQSGYIGAKEHPSLRERSFMESGPSPPSDSFSNRNPPTYIEEPLSTSNPIYSDQSANKPSWENPDGPTV